MLVDPLSSLPLADSAALYLAIDSVNFIKSTVSGDAWLHLLEQKLKIDCFLRSIAYSAVLSEHEKCQKKREGEELPVFAEGRGEMSAPPVQWVQCC